MNRLIPRRPLLKQILGIPPAAVSVPELTLITARAMHIQSIPMCKRVGSSNNYAYLVVDDKSKDAVIIDPANPVAPVLKDAIQAGKINLTAIVNTHQLVLGAGGARG
ncbi:metallo-beta-lactamase superfamily domain-containing protein [Purpureocillium lilacinum]|uniref:Metallo-beta-lactamase superfamily domain-containing protein n=1 Tax=Purpureocillium lilacinum TaxID=33203 RepID=A0A179H5L9_PURLI|nr:metallo-beta-lactamase superfamily domain-containing protein [Purpureocillium lilacinum]OAQ85457.1 metallo-beta-lactamase superfamily domain-containing protein [Purpureocillium lilacinum]